jgi:hypothetical protein
MRIDLIDSGINNTIDTVAYKQNDILAKQDELKDSADDLLSSRNTNTLSPDSQRDDSSLSKRKLCHTIPRVSAYDESLLVHLSHEPDRYSHRMYNRQHRGHPPDPTMKQVEVGERPTTYVQEDIVPSGCQPEEGEIPDGHDAC